VTEFSYADIFERVATIRGDAPAVICDQRTTTWAQFNARADALAAALVERGLQPGAKVALLMRNGPDYLIAFFACFKARLVSVNINFRYGPNEVDYLLDNADVEGVVLDAEFASTLAAAPTWARIAARFSARNPTPGACDLEAVYAAAAACPPMQRSGEDIFLLYQGGTTGLPKGVMWPSASVWAALASARVATPGAPAAQTLEDLDALLASAPPEGPLYYVAPPLMHGTGLFSAISVLTRGGCVVCSGAPNFSAQAALAAIVAHRCEGIVVVGDAFARPLLTALDSAPTPYDVVHVASVVSSGMIWSPEVKAGLLRHMPNAALADGLGASEASSIAFSVTTRDTAGAPTRFAPVDAIVVRPDDFTPVQPGSGEIGVIAKAGPLPLGYYKDPERTARTYVTIDGVRRMISGDHATVEADGTIVLLGRGGHVINSAGEKIYPEEVEEALKTHPDVSDALVVGIPDPRFGQIVAAVVETESALAPDALVAHIKTTLAGYKAPKRIVFTKQAPRGPNGKADYASARAMIDAQMAGESPS